MTAFFHQYSSIHLSKRKCVGEETFEGQRLRFTSCVVTCREMVLDTIKVGFLTKMSTFAFFLQEMIFESFSE